MPRSIAYIRVSTDTQDTDKQRLEILDYANRHGLKVDEFIAIEISSRRTSKERRIDELMEKLHDGDTLIVSELSRIGRSIPEVIGLVNAMIERGIRLVAIKQGLDIKGNHDIASKVMVTIFALLAELERDLTSYRTKTALAALKSGGKILGRPKGRKGKSRMDIHEPQIRELLAKKVSKSSIAKIIGVSRAGLIKHLKSRNIS